MWNSKTPSAVLGGTQTLSMIHLLSAAQFASHAISTAMAMSRLMSGSTKSDATPNAAEYKKHRETCRERERERAVESHLEAVAAHHQPWSVTPLARSPAASCAPFPSITAPAKAIHKQDTGNRGKGLSQDTRNKRVCCWVVVSLSTPPVATQVVGHKRSRLKERQNKQTSSVRAETTNCKN